MVATKMNRLLSATAAVTTVSLFAGWVAASPLLFGAGAAGGIYVLVRTALPRRRLDSPVELEDDDPAAACRPPAAGDRVIDPEDTGALVEQLLAQGRFPLLLRPQVAGNLTVGQFEQALEALHNAMALVPEGEVALGTEREDDEDDRDEETCVGDTRVVCVERFFLDRYPVTNRQFFEFVAAGGYEQMVLWDPAIWPAVLDFVDRTGEPGPRFWKSGCYLRGQQDHPVVGISWYEAAAYARWLGKRLPTDAEWVKAGSWPVPVSTTSRQQRKYPWGETMDRTRANLWGSGAERVVAVAEFASGVSVGGVYQLVGNVWEWTASNFRGTDRNGDPLILPRPMKSVRGGAFDTYFDNQATCRFQSGEALLSRKHNIGMRCAVGACDLMMAQIGRADDDRDHEEQDGQEGDPTAVPPAAGEENRA